VPACCFIFEETRSAVAEEQDKEERKSTNDSNEDRLLTRRCAFK